MVHFILVLKLIFSSSPFLHRSVSSFTHWSAGTFNCPCVVGSGVSNVDKCGRLSQSSWLLGALFTCLLTYIVASPSLATSPECRTAPQHIKPYSLTSTSHSVVFPIHPGVVGLVAGRPRGKWIDQIRNDTSQTPADLWRQALGRGHHGRTTRRTMLASYSPNSTWLDSTPHVRLCRASRASWASRDERVERDEPCCSNMADDEESVVLACTSFVFCALSVHVNKTEKRRHAVWVKNYLEKRETFEC